MAWGHGAAQPNALQQLLLLPPVMGKQLGFLCRRVEPPLQVTVPLGISPAAAFPVAALSVLAFFVWFPPVHVLFLTEPWELCGTEGTHPAECVTLQGWAGCSQLLHVDLFGLWCLLAFTAAEVMTGLHPVRSCAWLLGLFRSACGCPALSWVLFAALISTALEWLCRVQGL